MIPTPYKIRKRGTEYVYFCSSPVCAGRPPRLELNIETGVFHCFRCGRAGKLKELVGRKKIIQVPEETSQGELSPVPRSLHRHLEERGFDPNYLVHRYGLKWDGYRLCWPVGTDLESPDCWWRRGVYSWQDPKVLFPPGEEKGVLGAHLLRPKKHVVITEGDYKAASIPLPFVGVGIGGTTITEYQRDLILVSRPMMVYVMLDGGSRFRRNARRIKDQFIGKFQDAAVVPLLEEQGPDDLPMEERISALLEVWRKVKKGEL